MPASYRDLGATQLLLATPDATGNNLGNWTVTATQAALKSFVAQAEIYQISIDGPIGSSVKIYRNTHLWNAVYQGWSNSWDPVNPLYVRPGDTVFFYWNALITTTPVPTAKLWLRYDTELQENKYAAGG
jgi:hypothetical protein